jgi:hypothetical protein
VPRRFRYSQCPHRGDHFLGRSGLPAGGFHTHFELRHLDGPHFPRRDFCPSHSNGDVQKIVKTFSDRMVKCWIRKIYLTNHNTESSTFSYPM